MHDEAVLVRLPRKVCERFSLLKKKEINYADLIRDYEEHGRVDIQLDTPMRMDHFYDMVKKDGREVDESN